MCYVAAAAAVILDIFCVRNLWEGTGVEGENYAVFETVNLFIICLRFYFSYFFESRMMVARNFQ